MLTGNVPLANAPRPSRLNNAIPRRLDRAIMRAIDPEPENRYPSAAAMRDAIGRAAVPAKSRWWLAAVLAGAGLLALLAVLLAGF